MRYSDVDEFAAKYGFDGKEMEENEVQRTQITDWIRIDENESGNNDNNA